MDSSSVAAAAVDSVADDFRKQTLQSNDVADVKSDGDSSGKRIKLKFEELNWDNSFVRELPGDPRTDTISREVFLYSFFPLISLFLYIYLSK